MDIPNRKKKKHQTPESKLRFELDTCTKNKDIITAISLYQSAISQNIHLTHHHFNSFLYILSNSNTPSAIEYAFKIFNHMISSKINPNEATITSVARLAAAKNDGVLAFDLVKSMGEYGVLPKLRSFGPALGCFCKNLDADMAYLVEEHMGLVGLEGEENELSLLLKVSVECGRGEKVYEYLHKIRRVLGCVSEEVGKIIEAWFNGEVNCDVGLVDLDVGLVKDVILRNGGGWHGLGWIGEGRWVVRRSTVNLGACCCSCGEQLVCVDIDKVETEKFATSVASLAMEREVHSNFTEFQNWLEEHSDYEDIVDGANIGLYQQNFAEGGFSMSQLDAVVKELYNRRKKWPLVVLHKKRIHTLLENYSNRELLEKWMDQGVLYGTPYGSNDDWYWLYAAVKLKCLLVTNDEMRDHIFELIGSSFFLKWKERHQVRYTFVKGNLKLQMPPSYSAVIQESEKGTWHVPLAGECGDESSRTWLCITRPASHTATDEVTTSIDTAKISQLPFKNNGVNGNSDSFRCSDNNTTTVVTGKRKERSPSPSKPCL